MRLSGAANLAFEQGRGDAFLDPAGSLERMNARSVELQNLSALRLPVGDRLVELGKDLRRLLAPVPKTQDAAEAGEQGCRRLGFADDADLVVDLDGDAGEAFGFLVAALLDQDAGKAHDVFGGQRMVLALFLQAREQRTAGIDLGLGEPPLPRLPARLAEHPAVGVLQQLRQSAGTLLRSTPGIDARLRRSANT